jgi:hypothetical protein
VSHVVVTGEDALVAALKLKAERSEAMIMYVRLQNRRGDARKPPFDAVGSSMMPGSQWSPEADLE